MNAVSAAGAKRRQTHSVGFNLAAIAVAAAVCGLALAYGIDAIGRSSRASGPTAIGGDTVVRALASRQLVIPSRWMRSDDDGGTGFARQVALRVDVPLGPDRTVRSIDITLMPRSRVRPSASLLDGVYLHEFTADQVSGPPGLVGKPMTSKDGFAGETVWYDALSSQPFVAKCASPVADGQPGRCLRAVYLGPGIAAVYNFDDDVLQNWQEFDAELRPVLSGIGAL